MSEHTGAVVSIRRLDSAEGLRIPEYMSEGAAGMDLPAAVAQSVVLQPGDFATIPTGFAVAIPRGYEGQVRPRSGLAARHGIGLVNSPGTIDSDYRGEISVIVINLGREPFTVVRGMRIAQLVIAPVTRAGLELVEDLPDTERGAGGFGHTGL